MCSLWCKIDRYSFKNYSISATASLDAVDVSYWQKINDCMQLSSSFILNKKTSKTLGSVCYQVQIKDAVIKGMIDSDWSVGCTYNRYIVIKSMLFKYKSIFISL